MGNAVENLYGALSPELKLVLLCSRSQITEKEEDTLDRLLTGHIDWKLFVHLTLHHRTYPLAYRNLSNIAHPAVPGEVVAALRQKSQQNISVTFHMMAELVRVLQAMEQNGIQAVVIKGFPLAYKLYRDVMLRPSKDLDILVCPQDIEKARQIIEEQGYLWRCPISKSTPTRIQKWIETNQHLEYWHPDRQICLELHWRLYCHGTDIPLIQAENNLAKVQIAGQTINVLGKEELLLYLVLHGAVHAWFRLKWLCDVDIMIKQMEFSWERLYHLANSLGVKSILNQSIILSKELIGTRVPVEITEIVTKDRRAQGLAAMALRYITDNDYNPKPKSLYVTAALLYHNKKYPFYLHSKWQERLSVISRWFSPSEEDIKLLSLSDKLYFMYYILSPITWFGRRVRSVARRHNLM